MISESWNQTHRSFTEVNSTSHRLHSLHCVCVFCAFPHLHARPVSAACFCILMCCFCLVGLSAFFSISWGFLHLAVLFPPKCWVCAVILIKMFSWFPCVFSLCLHAYIYAVVSGPPCRRASGSRGAAFEITRIQRNASSSARCSSREVEKQSADVSPSQKPNVKHRKWREINACWLMFKREAKPLSGCSQGHICEP